MEAEIEEKLLTYRNELEKEYVYSELLKKLAYWSKISTKHSRILLVRGCKGFNDKKFFKIQMDSFVIRYGIPEKIISMGSRGTNYLATKWAKNLHVELEIVKPNFKIIAECTHYLVFCRFSSTISMNLTQRAVELKKKVRTAWWIPNY